MRGVVHGLLRLHPHACTASGARPPAAPTPACLQTRPSEVCPPNATPVQVVLLAGIDATYRRGAQIQDAQQLRLWRSGTAPRDNAASAPAIPELEASWWEDVPLDSRSSQPWAQLQACVESGLPVTALLRFVAEGDNRQDAVDLATAAGKLLELCPAARQTWHPPAAWTWLFGGPAAVLA